jgi:hypothetical protein
MYGLVHQSTKATIAMIAPLTSKTGVQLLSSRSRSNSGIWARLLLSGAFLSRRRNQKITTSYLLIPDAKPGDQFESHGKLPSTS